MDIIHVDANLYYNTWENGHTDRFNSTETNVHAFYLSAAPQSS